jgi:hypothetical protein
MNVQLIIELEKQASNYYWSLDDGVRTTDAFTQKFAELIVKECILQCNDGDSRYFISTHFEIPEARDWLCPRCGVDRGKEACPSGYNSLLVDDCPMVGTAQ